LPYRVYQTLRGHVHIFDIQGQVALGEIYLYSILSIHGLHVGTNPLEDVYIYVAGDNSNSVTIIDSRTNTNTVIVVLLPVVFSSPIYIQ